MNHTVDLRLREAREQGLIVLDEHAGKEILASAGIRVPRAAVVPVGGDVRAAARSLRAPFVLKVIAPGVVHKSDVGGVRIDLRDIEELVASVAQIDGGLRERGIEPRSWLVEEMVPGGVEVVVGGLHDPEFGPMVMVGLGGIFVEVLKDVAFRICPIDARDAREMIDELRGSPLLYGARGREPVSRDAIVDVLSCLGGADGLLMRCGEHVAEIDINPLIVSGDSAFAADARFILRQAG